MLQLVDRDPPAPGPGEVRVRVAVSGVNPADCKARSGASNPGGFPEVTPHLDGAGVIDAVGAGVDRGRVGERVWLSMATAGRHTGTAAEFAVVPAGQAVPLPDAAGSDVGASLGVPALTASRRSPRTVHPLSPRTGRADRGGAQPVGEEHGLLLVRSPLDRTADAHRATAGAFAVAVTPARGSSRGPPSAAGAARRAPAPVRGCGEWR
ncbi:alcohol dehydrogenase catalytic domain-containing protein [Nonomuraea jabiensis]|uniref:alcohol dehydrogenase catalytic domain-containing protein n=1 Tax=Nonomuraea jabiensis TaxID=882448 RepID=UPI0036B6C21E